MVHLHALPDDAALAAIESGEFPADVTGAPNVAIIMTQSWCVDWIRMKAWLARFERRGAPENLEINVYVLEYNKVDYFHRFMEHKESVFANAQIPYIRYYSNGEFRGESNAVYRDDFLKRFARG
jgi:hypothetical protein